MRQSYSVDSYSVILRAFIRFDMALHLHPRRSTGVRLVVVDVLHGRNFPCNCYLDRTHAASLRCPASQDHNGPDRVGKLVIMTMMILDETWYGVKADR